MNILSYKGYKGLFGYDPEREVFHGDVINLTDVITFQGRSIDELKQSLADSVDDYLSFCKESGKTPDKPYSGRFNIRIDPDLHRQLVYRAASTGKSLNRWLSECLKELAAR
jgi:predicted HicB family RNase H-like nuclease